MMKSVVTLFFLFILSLNFAQNSTEELNKIGRNPIILIDSVRINNDEIQNYDPKEIAILSQYTGNQALELFPEGGNDGVIYIETKKFSKKRFENYFKTKSKEYRNLLSRGIDDTKIQYILNNKVLTTDFEGDLASINDNFFKSLKVIDRKELQKKFNLKDKDYGIIITSDVPDNLQNGTEKFNK